MNERDFNNIISIDTDSIQKDGNQWSFTFLVNPDADLLTGHFPEVPILPGATMIYLVQHAAEMALLLPLQMVEGLNFKFLKVINPLSDRTFSLELTIEPTEDIYRIKSKIVKENSIFFKSDARYEPCKK
ncbi:MAG TPA: hypothetical protein DDX92_06890 [Flavobacteriales bacterium]|jgi:3-hydroxymyristoyl/3-hydroxydecanoyl-(acyl carrier protein) dehydratase|nr:hypothetical protein [Flavobacteriales bacterium]